MTNRNFLPWICIVSLAAAASLPAAPITLVENGRARAVIVVPENAPVES
ncbi:MAG: hypothetical protein ACREH8_05285 [Opitutaceae bacterium]